MVVRDVESGEAVSGKGKGKKLWRVGPFLLRPAAVLAIVLFLLVLVVLLWHSSSKLGSEKTTAEVDTAASVGSIADASASRVVDDAAAPAKHDVQPSEEPDDYEEDQEVDPAELVKLQEQVSTMEASLRDMHGKKVVMEQDEEALVLIARFQERLRDLLERKYGSEPVVVEMDLEFPPSIPGENQIETLTLQVAPFNLVPYSAYYWLSMVEEWEGGYFHRNAGHVMQAHANKHREGLAFQEYHPDFPHEKYTLGFAGRPGGPEFYISTVDNTRNHGPASQGSKTEADSCFAKVIKGQDAVSRMQKQQGTDATYGFVKDRDNWIRIVRLEVVYNI